MSESKDTLYDISDAIALSRRLTDDREGAAAETASPYIQFTADTRGSAPAARPTAPPAPPAATAPPSASPSQAPAPLPDAPFHSWDDVLRWSVEFTKARCGFIVDSQGFVMITHGESIPGDGFEGAGANLGAVFIYMNRLDLDSGDARAADLTFGTRAFLALRIDDDAGEYCMLGLISDDSTHTWPKQAIYTQIMNSMSELLL